MSHIISVPLKYALKSPDNVVSAGAIWWAPGIQGVIAINYNLPICREQILQGANIFLLFFFLLPCNAFLSPALLWCTRERHINQVRNLLSMRSILPESTISSPGRFSLAREKRPGDEVGKYSFEPKT